MNEPTLWQDCGHDTAASHNPGCRLNWVVLAEPDQFQRVSQEGGMGSWRCNTCGTDCRADGPGCEGSDYDFTPSYWPDNDGDYMLVPCPGAVVGTSFTRRTDL